MLGHSGLRQVLEKADIFKISKGLNDRAQWWDGREVWSREEGLTNKGQDCTTNKCAHKEGSQRQYTTVRPTENCWRPLDMLRPAMWRLCTHTSRYRYWDYAVHTLKAEAGMKGDYLLQCFLFKHALMTTATTVRVSVSQLVKSQVFICCP